MAAAVILGTLFGLIPLFKWEWGIWLIWINFSLFLGDSKRDFFFLFEILVMSSLLGGAISVYRERKKTVPYGFSDFVRSWQINRNLIHFCLCAFIISACVSLPFDLKETFMEICNTPVLKSITRFFYGHEGREVFWLRGLWNHVSAVLIFFLIRLKWKQVRDIHFTTSIMLITAIQICFGFLFICFPQLCPRTSYVFLSLQGWQSIGYGKIALVGLAKNCGYFAQFAVFFWPFLLFGILGEFPKKIRYINAVLLILVLLAIPFTFQRTPILIVIIQGIICFMCLGLFQSAKKQGLSEQVRRIIPACIFVLGFLGLYFSIDMFWWDGRSLSRFLDILRNPSLRDDIWQVAIEMFKNEPFFGIGTAQFHEYFPVFCQKAGIEFVGQLKVVRTTAHNLYLHLLAENGFIGLGLLFSAIVATGIRFFNYHREAHSEKIFHAILFTSWAGFLLYGMSQYMFYIRSMQIMFFITWAMLLNVSEPTCKDIASRGILFSKMAGSWFAVVIIIGMVFHGFRMLQL